MTGPMLHVGWASASAGRHVAEVVSASAAERAAARGQHEPADLVGPAAPQALRQRGVLGVDRNDLAGLRARHHQLAAHDQRLLVGERKRRARVQSREGGRQPDAAGDRVEHDVAGHRRYLLSRVAAYEDLGEPEPAVRVTALLGCRVQRELEVLGRGPPRDRDHVDPELDGLCRQQLRTAAAARQADHAEAVGVRTDDVERLGADRAGRAEHDDVAYVRMAAHHRIVPCLRMRRRVTRSGRGPVRTDERVSHVRLRSAPRH